MTIRYHLGAKLDPDNAGVLVVDLTGQTGSDVSVASLSIFFSLHESSFECTQDTVMDDMARSTPGDSDQCIIC